MNKKEKNYLDPESNNTQNHYINTSYGEELKSIQKSIADLRQDIRKIIHEEFVAARARGVLKAT